MSTDISHKLIETTLTVQSAIHGERIWRRVGDRDHETRDGRAMVLAVWETPCVVCGGVFQIATLPHYVSAEHSKILGSTTCPDHRMTQSEISRLRYAKATARHSIFDEIRKAKLATHSPEPSHMTTPSPGKRPKLTMITMILLQAIDMPEQLRRNAYFTERSNISGPVVRSTKRTSKRTTILGDACKSRRSTRTRARTKPWTGPPVRPFPSLGRGDRTTTGPRDGPDGGKGRQTLRG
jgi:hypothetical protein